MRYIPLILFFCFFCFNSFKIQAEDALTMKQQLDRIMEELKDLNKAVFNKSFDNDQIYTTDTSNDAERFTSIDIRIYDLEKDIKNLTLQFEEILFKLDDISDDMNSLELDLFTELEKIKIVQKEDFNKNNEIENTKDLSVKEENILGKIVISDNNNITSNTSPSSSSDNEEGNNNSINNLTPEEQLQLGIDQLRKKNYNESKKILSNFIDNFPDNKLSGSAHFWLGKIYLFEEDFRNAAIVFGEGVQKFPKSIKSAEMYYELARSLKEMDKSVEACKTLSLLEKNYKDSKFVKDPEKIRDQLNCTTNN